MRLFIKHKTFMSLKFKKGNRKGVVLQKHLKKYSSIKSQDTLKSYKLRDKMNLKHPEKFKFIHI